MKQEDRERIETLLREHKLNMKAVSLAAGRNETFVRDMLKRDKDPSHENYKAVLDAIARLAGRVPLAPAPSDIAPADVEMPTRASMPRDIDVLTAVAASEPGRGSFQFSLDPIDRVARPPGLIGVRNVYAAYVENDSMWPKYNPGDLVFISRSRPPAPGDVVVIQNSGPVEGDVEGYIKILVRRTAEWIECRQLFPEGPVKYRNGPNVLLHRVFTNNELFGI